MKQKLYLFLSMSIPFGLIMGLTTQNDKMPFYEVALWSGISFGLLMTIILSLIQMYYLNKTGNAGAKVTLVNERVVELNGSKREVMDHCRHALDAIESCSLLERNEGEGLIRAKAGRSLYSWGEDIVIRVQEMEEDRHKVMIRSAPAVKTTLIDYGKNLDNVKRIVQFLQP